MEENLANQLHNIVQAGGMVFPHCLKTVRSRLVELSDIFCKPKTHHLKCSSVNKVLQCCQVSDFVTKILAVVYHRNSYVLHQVVIKLEFLVPIRHQALKMTPTTLAIFIDQVYTISKSKFGSRSRRIRGVSHNPPEPVILSRLFEYGTTPKLHSGETDVLDVQLKQLKCIISAGNVNKSGRFYTEIKRQQIKLSLMFGLERASQMFTSSVMTIHTTHVQEPGRKEGR